MAEHILKTWPNSFDAIASGNKRFEYRKDDRGFEVGDVLMHLDFLRVKDDIEIRVHVTYILRGMHDVPYGYCVMSINRLAPESMP